MVDTPTFGKRNAGAGPPGPGVRRDAGGGIPPGGIRPGAEPVVGLRFVSGLVDFVVLSLATGAVFAVVDLSSSYGEGSSTAGLVLFGMLVLMWFGYGVVLDARGGTVGKLVTGTRVVDERGRFLGFAHSLGRNLGKVLSAVVPLYIPYLMVFFTNRNQTLHDMMAKTLVFKKGDLLAVGSAFD